jgi:hypothetical protein
MTSNNTIHTGGIHRIEDQPLSSCRGHPIPRSQTFRSDRRASVLVPTPVAAPRYQELEELGFRVVEIHWEFQKESQAETIEGKLLHDAHLLEGGKTFMITALL